MQRKSAKTTNMEMGAAAALLWRRRLAMSGIAANLRALNSPRWTLMDFGQQPPSGGDGGCW
jgi:hypothetical protein